MQHWKSLTSPGNVQEFAFYRTARNSQYVLEREDVNSLTHWRFRWLLCAVQALIPIVRLYQRGERAFIGMAETDYCSVLLLRMMVLCGEICSRLER